MKKIIVLIFLNSKSTRYTGINYSIKSEKISNFQKIRDFLRRDKNYKELVNNINAKEKDQVEKIFNISKWVYKNIEKISLDRNEIVIDSHPWTIVERKMGANDQLSDILSVLFVYANFDSFFLINASKYRHSITLFKINNSWSLVDPYYGIYFLNDKNKFCNLDEFKYKNCIFYHLEYGKISNNLLKKIFFNMSFRNLDELNNYYYIVFKDIPTAKKIDATNIYLRGGRSYVQKPIHRLIYQIQKSIKLIN